jgi:hypothetical protein
MALPKLKDNDRLMLKLARKRRVKLRKMQIAARRRATWDFSWGHECPSKRSIAA